VLIMLASSFLDTAIGIVFVFLLLSLIASTVNEIILSTISMRGRYLLRGLKTLLNDAKATGLVSQIYNHGQIFGLYQGNFNPQKPRNLPSYIPSSNFVMAFLGIIPEAPVAIATAREAEAIQAAESAKTAADKAPNDQAAGAKVVQLMKEAEAAKKAKDAAVQTAKDAKAALETVVSAAGRGAGVAAATTAAQEAAAKATAAAQAAQEAKAAADADPTNKGAVNKAEASAKDAEIANQAKAAADKAVADQVAGVQLTVAFQSLKKAAQDLANNPATEKVGKPLIEMMNEAGNDINNLKASLAAWYDSAMDRVSGWYKYHTQWILFWIGLVLAVGLNADTTVIVHQLSTDATLRQSVVAAAQSVKPPSDSSKPANPIGEVQEQIQKIAELGIPLGWKGTRPSTRQDWVAWLRKFLKAFPGFLLTAIAVSLGAPFWFDILNKIMVVRSTVKPHEKSKEEGTKDKP
jgi:hypothetical protein